MNDINLISQLEVSFLSNVKRNFNPIEFDYRFNNCLLPELKKNSLKKGIKGADLFTFRCTFSSNNLEDEDLKNIILNLEQVGYTNSNRGHFPRNIRRMIDGRNCLESMFRNSNKFSHVKYYIIMYNNRFIMYYI